MLCRGHRSLRCVLQTGGQNKFHQPTGQEATWYSWRAEKSDHLRDIAWGTRGPWDRPVGRSVDRCILIGFLPWTVWTARGPSRGPFRGPLYFDRFCPVDRKFILENKINLIF